MAGIMQNDRLEGLAAKPLVRIPKVSVILLNLNSYDDTRDCLLSLRKVLYANFETIVVDNGSSDDSSPRLRREFPEIKLIVNPKNLGFTGGNNLAIEAALKNEAAYIILLNNDTVVDPNFLSRLVAVGETDPRIGILAPKILYATDPQRIWFAGGFVSCRSGLYGHIGQDELDAAGKFSRVQETDWITGCAFFVKASVFREVGLLDARFFIYSEDADFCMRARNAGYKCMFVPDAKIWHKISRTCGAQSPFTLYLGTRNHLIWMAQYVPFPYKITAMAFALLKKLARAALLVFKRPEAAAAVVAGMHAFFFRTYGAPRYDWLPARQTAGSHVAERRIANYDHVD